VTAQDTSTIAVYMVPLIIVALGTGQRARLLGLMICAVIVALVGFGDWRGFP